MPGPPLLERPEVRAHLEATVRCWLGLPAGSDAAVPELPEPLARRLLRLEEAETGARDGWDTFEFQFARSFREGRLWEAEVDRWVAEQAADLGLTTARWPGGAPFAVCLTHDVDLFAESLTPRQALRLARARTSRYPAAPGADVAGRAFRAAGAAVTARARGLRRAPDAGSVLGRCVAVEREHGVRGTYFCVAPAGPATNPYDTCVYHPEDPCTWEGERTTVAGVLGALAGEGHEIGLHGSYASARDPAALAAERERLREATGLPVTSARQHWLHWDAAVTPAHQEAAGLEVDSTVGFNRTVGFRAGTALPHRPVDLATGRPLDLLELPLVVQDAALTGSGALELDPAGAREVTFALMDEVAGTGGTFTFLVHPHSLLDEAHEELYRAVVQRALGAGAWVATAAEIAAHWRAREASLA